MRGGYIIMSMVQYKRPKKMNEELSKQLHESSKLGPVYGPDCPKPRYNMKKVVEAVVKEESKDENKRI